MPDGQLEEALKILVANGPGWAGQLGIPGLDVAAVISNVSQSLWRRFTKLPDDKAPIDNLVGYVRVAVTREARKDQNRNRNRFSSLGAAPEIPDPETLRVAYDPGGLDDETATGVRREVVRQRELRCPEHQVMRHVESQRENYRDVRAAVLWWLLHPDADERQALAAVNLRYESGAAGDASMHERRLCLLFVARSSARAAGATWLERPTSQKLAVSLPASVQERARDHCTRNGRHRPPWVRVDALVRWLCQELAGASGAVRQRLAEDARSTAERFDVLADGCARVEAELRDLGGELRSAADEVLA